MLLILLVIHIMVAFALIGVVLLQKSEGGALGIGGGMAGFMTGRSTANLLTRATAILAAAFFITSVLLVVMHNRAHAPASIIDQGAPAGPARPPTPLAPAVPVSPASPAKPAAPAVPAPTNPSVPLAH